jgi:hypothetical protein
VIAWISDNRFTIATWLSVLAGVVLLALAVMRSMRAAQGWKPRIRLGEWMEMPPAAQPSRQPRPVSDGVAQLNRRVAAAAAVVGTTVLSLLVEFAIWMRDVVYPRQARRLAHAAEIGRVESRARLDSLRDLTLHLQFAARAWYAAAGAPALNDFGVKAAEAVRVAAAAGKRGVEAARPTSGQVVDIQALMSAQSIGWYGPLTSLPPEGEQDGAEAQRSDRLAS